MSIAVQSKIITPEEYLELERKATTKSEYWNGHVYAMAGASLIHNTIVGNLNYRLRGQLEGKPCRVYTSDLKVSVNSEGNYFYPDVVLVCGEHQFQDGKDDVLLNPVGIVEVLSSSTEAYDRGNKFASYRKIKTLQEYILIAQDQISVEKYVRNGKFWTYSAETQKEKLLEFESISCSLLLSKIYENVIFE